MRLAKRFPRYNALLKLYPPAYRQKYAEQMLQTLADMLDDAPSPAAKNGIWVRTIADLPASVLREQVTYSGRAIAHDTPSFVKRNSLLAGLLLLPFFIIVAANDVSAHNLYHSWLWHRNVLFTWIIALPTIAAALSITTLIAWMIDHKRSPWKSLLDIRHNWPMLGIIVLGLGILAMVFFHDSVHCVVGNPITEVQHAAATWRCVQQP